MNDREINEKLIRKNVEESGCGLFYSNIPELG
jgi:hypothetical protein